MSKARLQRIYPVVRQMPPSRRWIQDHHCQHYGAKPELYECISPDGSHYYECCGCPCSCSYMPAYGRAAGAEVSEQTQMRLDGFMEGEA